MTHQNIHIALFKDLPVFHHGVCQRTLPFLQEREEQAWEENE